MAITGGRRQDPEPDEDPEPDLLTRLAATVGELLGGEPAEEADDEEA